MSNLTDLNQGPIEFFTGDHRACDETWAAVESAVESGDNAAASTLFDRFDGEMRRHLAMEEEVLFPEFEAASGMRTGPTEVMRIEHQQMRGLLDQMRQAKSSNDFDLLVDHGDTLLMLIQQHNVKEENMLYPMTERFLRPSWSDVSQKLSRYLEIDG